MKKLFFAITGGGSWAINEYLSEGGKSDHFMEAVVPYSTKALDNFLGRAPDNYCSQRTALQMATTAFARLIQKPYSFYENECAGIGVTASLYKKEQREGRKNLFHVAYHDLDRTSIQTYEFNGPLGHVFDHNAYRLHQEKVCSTIVLCSVGLSNKKVDISSHARRTDVEEIYPYDLLDVYNGEMTHVVIGKGYPFNKLTDQNIPDGSIIYSGSFDPFHEAHAAMLKKAKELYPGSKAFLEIAVTNFDKPPVDYISLYNRINQIPDGICDGIIISSNTRFVEKANCYKGIYIVGYDTLYRIDDYEIAMVQRDGSTFLAFPRDGYDVGIQKYLIGFGVIDVKDFKPLAISSTEIRKNNDYSRPISI